MTTSPGKFGTRKNNYEQLLHHIYQIQFDRKLYNNRHENKYNLRKVCYDCFNKDLHNLDLENLNNLIDNSDNEINNTNNKDDEENSVSNESYVPVNEKVGAAYPLQVKHKKGTYGSCNICI